MTLSFTILPHGPDYTFIWTPHTSATARHGTLRTRAAAHCLAHVHLHPQQQMDLQSALDAAAQIANQLQRSSPAPLPVDETASHPLKRLGRVLFSQLLPPDLQAHIRQLPMATPIFISTNDTSLPWELLHDDHNFLALRHGVGRSMLTEESGREYPSTERKQLSCLLIGNPSGDLAAADEEIEALLDVLDASPQRPRVEFLCREQTSKVQVLAALASGDYDIVHFACHARPGALRLADDWLHTAEIQAALRGNPIIFLNACNSARALEADATALPIVGHYARNLAFAFLAGGACAFIGTLWPVADTGVKDLAVEFYRLFLNGHAMGEALRRARLRSHAAAPSEITWAAPVLYGDPLNRLIPAGGFRQLGTVLDIRLSFSFARWQDDASVENVEKRQAETAQLVNTILGHGGEIITLSTERICAVFGVPRPFEDDAARAVRAALAVQQHTAAWEAGQPAIVIASGEIVLKSIANRTLFLESETSELPLCLGPAVAEAQQLNHQVRSGQILATERTRALTAPLFRFVPVTEEPVVAHEVSTMHVAIAARTAQPDAPQDRTTLFGREDELATLAAYWQMASQGRGQVVGILGEAGVGKTRLLQEFRQTLVREERTWLSGACPPTEQETPYALIGQLLRKMFDVAADDSEMIAQKKIEQRLGALQGRQEPVDSQLVQILNETLGLSQSELPIEERKARRGRLVHLLRTLMAQAARQKLLVIAIDDMHWVDEASLEILDQVTDGISRLPVQIVVLYRPEWQHPWFQKPYYRHLSLDHLDETACVHLLCALLETDELPAGLTPLLAKTAGNPFFIEEMVKSLQDTGVLVRQTAEGSAQGAATWELRQPLTAAQLPGTVQRTLLVRLGRLAPETRHVLQAAAVVGPLVAPPLLHAVLGHLDRPLDQHLADLEDRNFIHARWDVGDYQFRHALIQDAAYHSLPAAQRPVFHRRIAETLERASTQVQAETLAHHYYHSLLISPPGADIQLDQSVHPAQIHKAQTYLIQSGTRAQKRYAAREALNYYRRALAVNRLLGESEEAAIEIHEGLGDAHNILGDFDAAYKALRQAYAMLHTRPLTKADRRHAADLARRIGRLCMWKGEHDTALHWMEEGLRQLGELEDDEDKATAALLHIHSGSVHYNRGHIEEAAQASEIGLALVPGAHSLSVQAEGFNLLAIISWMRGANQDALTYFDHSLQRWRTLDNTYQAARISGNIGVVNFHISEWAVAQTYYRKCLAYWEQIGDRDMLAHTLLNMGNVYLCQGNWKEAHTSFENAFKLWQAVQNQRWIGLCHNNLGLLFIEMQEWQQANEHLTASHELLTRLSIQDLLPENYIGQAEVALGNQRLQQAVELGYQALALAQDLAMRAEYATALRVLAKANFTAGEKHVALERLNETLTIFQALENRFETGRTLYHLAQVEFASGNAHAALAHIDNAIETFQTLGVSNYLTKAHSSKIEMLSVT